MKLTISKMQLENVVDIINERLNIITGFLVDNDKLHYNIEKVYLTGFITALNNIGLYVEIENNAVKFITANDKLVYSIK